MTRSQLPYIKSTHSRRPTRSSQRILVLILTDHDALCGRTSVYSQKLHFARTRFSVVNRSVTSERSKSRYKVQNLISWFVRICFVGLFVEDKVNSQSTIFRDANSGQLLSISWNQTPFKKPEEFFKSTCKTQQKISGSSISPFPNQIIHAVSLWRKP